MCAADFNGLSLLVRRLLDAELLLEEDGAALLAESAALLMLLAAGAQADTLNVPTGTYPTIQAAIDAAAQGDTIVVAAGTYRESLSWVGKDLTLQGAGEGQSLIDPSSANGGPGGRC